jgi:dihydrofolate reductase
VDLLAYRDDAYLRDGLGVLSSSEAMLYGRTVYDSFAERWPARDHPWAARLTNIPKYVFSSTMEEASWGPTTIIRGDLVSEARRLKEKTSGDLAPGALGGSSTLSVGSGVDVSCSCGFAVDHRWCYKALS